jgi:hypothetical protein
MIKFEPRISIVDLALILVIYSLMYNLIPDAGQQNFMASTRDNWFKSVEFLLILSTFVAMNVNITPLRAWLNFSFGMIGLCKV